MKEIQEEVEEIVDNSRAGQTSPTETSSDAGQKSDDDTADIEHGQAADIEKGLYSKEKSISKAFREEANAERDKIMQVFKNMVSKSDNTKYYKIEEDNDKIEGAKL